MAWGGYSGEFLLLAALNNMSGAFLRPASAPAAAFGAATARSPGDGDGTEWTSLSSSRLESAGHVTYQAPKGGGLAVCE